MTGDALWGKCILLCEGKLLLLGWCEERRVDEAGTDSGYFYAGEGLGVFYGFDEADDGVFGGAVERGGDGP